MQESPRKVGEGAFGAYGRQGLEEFRAAFVMDGSNIVQPTDPGMWGKATQMEVNAARSPEPADSAEPAAPNIEDERWKDDGGSILGERLNQAEAARDVPGRDEKEIDKE
jgi:hypothetical protein